MLTTNARWRLSVTEYGNRLHRQKAHAILGHEALVEDI
jgi:hypothetical protein